MINLLLEAFIVESKTKPKINKPLFIIAIISMLSSLIFLFFYLHNFNIILGIISIISIIILYIDIAIWENRNLKQYKEKFDDHNKRLDNLKEVLQNFKYDNGKNWYSENKIKYLIDSCEKNIEERMNGNAKLTDLGKTTIFPIIAFVAGVVSDKSSINQAVGWGIIAFIVVVTAYSIVKLSTFVSDLVFKSSAIHEIKSLLSLLQDLLARDFE